MTNSVDPSVFYHSSTAPHFESLHPLFLRCCFFPCLNFAEEQTPSVIHNYVIFIDTLPVDIDLHGKC